MENYERQVRLLLDVLPFVAKEECFALHGGTAINLFVRDMPRLSVDIDLTYLPVESRDVSLKSIGLALGRIKQEIEQYREAAAKLSLSAGSAECVWTGRRITSLLWRDDVDTARRYIDLYDRFGCSAEHLKLTFRCVIRQGPIDPKAADRLAARVHDCWLDPEGTPTAASRLINGSPAKSGTIPN